MLNQDFKDILSILSAHKADFILVGAYALAVHGFPRATGDMDIYYRPEPGNAKKVWEALVEFGAPMDRFSLNDLTTPGMVIQVGIAPRRVDFINRISGVSYDEAASDAAIIDLDGVSVHVLSLAKMILNKKASGRPKDLIDLKNISEA